MKKVILLFFALLITVSGYSQGVLSLFTRSQEFLKAMEQEKFQEAQGFFDESVKSKISPENLQTIWTTLTTNYGKYVGMDVVQSKAEGDYFTVAVDAEFEKDTQGFLLVFNKGEKLMGLFPRQVNKVSAYVKPAYVDTTAFKEKEVYIVTPGHSLVGLLTTPAKGTNFPIVVFLHGSGPSDMDETVGPNKPFKDLAAGLASKGIASIRYVKRTLAYSGDFNKAFTVKEEVMDDALAAVALAKNTLGVDKSKIFVFGHSMGGMLAPKLAVQAPEIKGIVIAAAPARKLTDLIEEQNKNSVAQAKDTTGNLQKQLDEVLKETAKTRFTTLGKMKPDSVILGLPASYWADLNQYDQVATAKKLVKQKIFVVQGAFDFQIAQQDFDLWKAGLGKKSNVSFKLYPDLNHLFIPQKEKGDMSQYAIPGSVSGVLVEDVANWIKAK